MWGRVELLVFTELVWKAFAFFLQKIEYMDGYEHEIR